MNNDIIAFLISSESTKDFDPLYKVSDSTIKDILRIASNAPYGNNSQPWKVVVVQNKNT